MAGEPERLAPVQVQMAGTRMNGFVVDYPVCLLFSVRIAPSEEGSCTKADADACDVLMPSSCPRASASGPNFLLQSRNAVKQRGQPSHRAFRAPGRTAKPPSTLLATLASPQGFVTDTSAAVASLGGEKAIASARAANPRFLQLSMRPGDTLSHPLFGGLPEATASQLPGSNFPLVLVRSAFLLGLGLPAVHKARAASHSHRCASLRMASLLRQKSRGGCWQSFRGIARVPFSLTSVAFIPFRCTHRCTHR